MEALDLIFPLLAATLRVATPLLLTALAGLISERAGVIDIGLEGKMLMGAFASAAAASVTGSALLGLLAAIAASCALGAIHAIASVRLKGDQVVSGMAINIVSSGLTATLATAWFAQGGRTPPLPSTARFLAIELPLAQTLQGVPVLGRLWGSVLSGHSAPVYVAFALIPVVSFVLYRTRFGLRLRAAGEHPAAVDTAGIDVARLRITAVVIASVLTGAAGAYIATAQGAGFLRDMTAGRGFIALAAMILGHWKPWPTAATCVGFGFLDAAAIRLQGVAVPGIGQFPVQALQALPYLLTIILLAGFVGRAIPPKALGLPYVKER